MVLPANPGLHRVARRWTFRPIIARICVVKLPANATIAPEKLNKYLLVRQSRGDKSVFLAKAGYTAASPDQLLHDLRRQVLSQEAVPLHRTKFGQFYENSSTTYRPEPDNASNSFDLDEGALVWRNEVHYLGAG